MSKIKDNTSVVEIREQIRGAKELLSNKKLLQSLGVTPVQKMRFSSQIKQLEREFASLFTLPDKFNEIFKETGWVVYESLNVDVIENSVEIANHKGVSDGEEFLTSFYIDKEKTSHLCRKAKINLGERSILFELAIKDHFDGRYHSSVPLFLMIIDGFVNEEESTGFFAETTNLIAWDSIAGHETGLNHVSKLMSKMRGKTNTEEIKIPYRNGILHGRDLTYANPIVSSKSLAVIFSLMDWVVSKKKMKTGVTKEKYTSPSLAETFDSLTKFAEARAKRDQQDVLLTEWKKRNIEIGVSVKTNGDIEDFEKGSPERCLVEVFSLLNNKNYGGLVDKMHSFSPGESLGKRAGELRSVFENYKIKGFEILEIDDQAPAITEIRTMIELEINAEIVSREEKFRLIYSDASGTPLVRGFEEGAWRALDNFSTQWGFLTIGIE